MEQEKPKPFCYDDIQWTKKSPLQNEKIWERNKDLVKMLLQNGKAEKVERYLPNVGSNVPTNFSLKGFEGVEVWFSPHLEFYDLKIDGISGLTFLFKNKPELPAGEIVNEIILDANHLTKRVKRMDQVRPRG